MSLVGNDMVDSSGASRRFITLTCFLTAIAEGFDNQAMGVIAPKLIPALELSPSQAGWAFSACLFGLMIGAGLGGYLADRFGRRPVLVCSTMIFTIMTFATAFAVDFTSLVLIRTIAGLGLGGAMPMVVAMTSEAGARSRKVAAVAFAASGLPAGGLIAGLVARSMPAGEGWQTIFVIGGALSLVVLVLQVWLVPETISPQAGKKVMPKVQWSAAGAKLSILMCLSFALIALILHLLLNWLPTLMTERGFDIQISAEMLVWVNLGGIVGAIGLGLITERTGIKLLLPIVCIALAAVLFALGSVTLPWLALALGGLAGFLTIGCQFCLWGAASQYYSDAFRGRGVGMAVSAGRFGSAIGPLLAGELLQSGFKASQVMTFVATIGTAAALVIYFLGRIEPRPTSNHPET